MNIPNIITTFRLLLIPVFIYSFTFSQKQGSIIYPVLIFVLSGLSDILDGFIARKYNMKTELGAVLDPLADKLMLLTALICFAYYDYIPYWLVLIVALKEMTMIVGGFIYYKKGIVNPANACGKAATILFHLAIFSFLISNMLAYVLLVMSVLVSFLAFYKYVTLTLEKNRKLQNNRK